MQYLTFRPLFLMGALIVFSSCIELSAEEVGVPDLLSFSHGVLPVSVTSREADLKVGMEKAVAVIDGNPTGYVMTRKPATVSDVVEIVFSLPALTRFDGFAVPNVLETPSPSQTFFKNIEVLGSAKSAEGPFLLLAQGELATHDAKGQTTDLVMSGEQHEVLWIKLRLMGGIDVQNEKSFLEFSELIGTGEQREPDLSKQFSGVWSGRGVKLELAQEGATVTGCYDGNSTLTGTVQGNVLRALGMDSAEVPSQFILISGTDGKIRGLRSTNGAPFHPYNGDTSSTPPKCLAPEAPTLGCGSIVHGIGFDFDSATIRSSSQVIIADLHAGLSRSDSAGIQIIGHSSSEGTADYNRDLSQRRAQAVVDALIALGIKSSRISASGRGEDDPIASNEDEAGRSLNRRVEVQCTG